MVFKGLLILISFLNFGHAQVQFDLNEALLLARVTGATFSKDGDMNTCLSNIQTQSNTGEYNLILDEEVLCDSTDNTCRVVAVEYPDTKTIIIAQRGTVGKIQLLEEFVKAFQPVPLVGIGKVNGYFAVASDIIWQLISNRILDPKYDSHTLIFTGHSLGAALATTTAVRANKESNIPTSRIKLLTFGEPRVGFRDFALTVDSMFPDAIRITSGMDIVPRIPDCTRQIQLPNILQKPRCSTSTNNTYYHHGTELHFYNRTSLAAIYDHKVCTGAPINEDPTCIDKYLYLTTIPELRTYCDHRWHLGIPIDKYGNGACNEIPFVANDRSCLAKNITNKISFLFK